MLGNSSKTKRSWGALFLAFVIGLAVMAGTGFAVKTTDQAAFCSNCHAMSEVVWTHKNSIHAKLDCNECHTPYNLAEKLPFKTAIGLHDIRVNTFEDIAHVIHASQSTKDVIQANCRRCHYPTTMDVAMDVKPYCTDCHRSVPHNTKLPISKRKAADV